MNHSLPRLFDVGVDDAIGALKVVEALRDFGRSLSSQSLDENNPCWILEAWKDV